MNGKFTRRVLRGGCALLLVFAAPLPGVIPAGVAQAAPRGCASISNDYAVELDLLARRAVVQMNVDEPCTFAYVEGDTFSGSGKFTISCASGGYYHHPDYQDGKYPPVFDVPVPLPCAPRALVTVNAYRAGTGGIVVAGGVG